MPVVYILDADHGTKIGMSGNDGVQRLAAYKSGYGYAPRIVRLFAFETAREALRVEQLAHRLLRHDRKDGEWFWCHPLEAVAAVHRAWRSHQIIEATRIADLDDPFGVAKLDIQPLQISPA